MKHAWMEYVLSKEVYTRNWRKMTPQWAFKHAQYYINIADAIRGRKRCYSRQIGTVLVKDDSIVSTGFNGPPRGIPKCDEWCGNWWDEFSDQMKKEFKCPRKILKLPSGQGLGYCPAAHAERNALLLCAKHGIATNNGILFMTCGIPCKDCMIEIIQAGIQAVFCGDDTLYDDLSYRLAHKIHLPIYYVKDGIYKLTDKEFVKVEL
jgi:dCMP deaminase